MAAERTRVLLCAAPDSPVAGVLANIDVELTDSIPTHASRGVDVVVLTDDAAIGPREVFRVLDGEGVPILFVDQRGDGQARADALAAGCEDAVGPPLLAREIEHRLTGLLLRVKEHAAMATANKALRELAEKKRMLAALVVHDLRNPLTAIQGNLQLVGECVETTDPTALRALRDLRDLTDHTLGLVAGLLDVEELEEGLLTAEPKWVDVAELLGATSRHQRAVIEFRKLTLETEVGAELRAYFDPVLIGRVIENLVDNAVRYAPPGGRVVLRASRVGSLCIRVLNSGPPIPSERRQAVFERFFRVEARREGARANRGLGLYFCKLATRAHGGSLAVVDGDPELPSCFELILPQPSQ